jgi:hypothetical protein
MTEDISKESRPSREDIARIIDPELFEKYDLELASGRCAQNGRKWADVCYGEKRDATLAKADAILARLAAKPAEREATIEECANIVEQYGLDHLRAEKDYPATVAAACLSRIHALSTKAKL